MCNAYRWTRIVYLVLCVVGSQLSQGYLINTASYVPNRLHGHRSCNVRIPVGSFIQSHRMQSQRRLAPLQLQVTHYKGELQLQKLLTSEERRRLAELAEKAGVKPKDTVPVQKESAWRRWLNRLWPADMGKAQEAQETRKEPYMELLQRTFEEDNEREIESSIGRYPRKWFRRPIASGALEDIFSQAMEFVSLNTSAGRLLEDELLYKEEDRLWVRRLLKESDPLYLLYSQAYLDSHASLQRQQRPYLAPPPSAFLRAVSRVPLTLLNSIRRALPPVAGLLTYAGFPSDRPIPKGLAALLGAYLGFSTSSWLRKSRQISAYYGVSSLVASGRALSALERQGLAKEYLLSDEELSVVLMSMFGEHIIRTTLSTPIVLDESLDGLKDLSLQLCLNETEIAHSVWKVAKTWEALLNLNDELDPEQQLRLLFVKDSERNASRDVFDLWWEVSEVDRADQGETNWLGYHAQMLEPLWRRPHPPPIHQLHAELLARLSDKIAIQKVAYVLLGVLQRCVQTSTRVESQRWILDRLRVVPEEIQKFEQQLYSPTRTYATLLRHVSLQDNTIQAQQLVDAQQELLVPKELVQRMHEITLQGFIARIVAKGVLALGKEDIHNIYNMRLVLDVPIDRFMDMFERHIEPQFKQYCTEVFYPVSTTSELESKISADILMAKCALLTLRTPTAARILRQAAQSARQTTVDATVGALTKNMTIEASLAVLDIVGSATKRMQSILRRCGVEDHIQPIRLDEYSRDVATPTELVKTLKDRLVAKGYLDDFARRVMSYALDFTNLKFSTLKYELDPELDVQAIKGLTADIVAGRLTEQGKAEWHQNMLGLVVNPADVPNKLKYLYEQEVGFTLLNPVPDTSGLHKVQWYLNVTDEQAAKIHEDILGPVYRKAVTDILVTRVCPSPQDRLHLEQLQKQLLLTQDAATRLYRKAVVSQAQEMVNILGYEYDVATMYPQEYREKYGTDSGYPRLGLRARSLFMTETVRLLELLKKNDFLPIYAPNADGVPEQTLPVPLIPYATKTAREDLYKHYLLHSIVETDPERKQYLLDSKTLFALVLGVNPPAEANIRQALIDYFYRKILASAFEYDERLFREHFQLFHDVQVGLGVPAKEAEDVIRKLKAELIQSWLDQIQPTSPLDTARRLRKAMDSLGVDVVSDLHLAVEQRERLFQREVQETVEYDLSTETLAASQAGWKLSPSAGAKALKDIARNKVISLLSAAALHVPSTLAEETLSSEQLAQIEAESKETESEQGEEDSTATEEPLQIGPKDIQFCVDMALKYAQFAPEPAALEITTNRAIDLRNFYARLIFGSRPPAESLDMEKREKFEFLCKLLAGVIKRS